MSVEQQTPKKDLEFFLNQLHLHVGSFGKPDVIERIIERAKANDVDTTDFLLRLYQGQTVVHRVANYNKEPILKQSLDGMPELDTPTNKIPALATLLTYPEVLSAVNSIKDKNGNTVLMIAMKSGNDEGFKLILEKAGNSIHFTQEDVDILRQMLSKHVSDKEEISKVFEMFLETHPNAIIEVHDQGLPATGDNAHNDAGIV